MSNMTFPCVNPIQLGPSPFNWSPQSKNYNVKSIWELLSFAIILQGCFQNSSSTNHFKIELVLWFMHISNISYPQTVPQCNKCHFDLLYFSTAPLNPHPPLSVNIQWHHHANVVQKIETTCANTNNMSSCGCVRIRAVELACCPTRSHSRGVLRSSKAQVAHHTPHHTPHLHHLHHHHTTRWGSTSSSSGLVSQTLKILCLFFFPQRAKEDQFKCTVWLLKQEVCKAPKMFWEVCRWSWQEEGCRTQAGPAGCPTGAPLFRLLINGHLDTKHKTPFRPQILIKY